MVLRLESQSGEPVDKLLRRFKKAVDRSGHLVQARERRHYDKPSVVRRRKRNQNAFRTFLRQRRSL